MKRNTVSSNGCIPMQRTDMEKNTTYIRGCAPILLNPAIRSQINEFIKLQRPFAKKGPLSDGENHCMRKPNFGPKCVVGHDYMNFDKLQIRAKKLTSKIANTAEGGDQ